MRELTGKVNKAIPGAKCRRELRMADHLANGP
jgi:hypothetical protein